MVEEDLASTELSGINSAAGDSVGIDLTDTNSPIADSAGIDSTGMGSSDMGADSTGMDSETGADSAVGTDSAGITSTVMDSTDSDSVQVDSAVGADSAGITSTVMDSAGADSASVENKNIVRTQIIHQIITCYCELRLTSFGIDRVCVNIAEQNVNGYCVVNIRRPARISYNSDLFWKCNRISEYEPSKVDV